MSSFIGALTLPPHPAMRALDDLRQTVDQIRTRERAVMNLIGSSDALSLAIQPPEAFGRRVGRFHERLPRRREPAAESPVDPG